MQDQKIMSDHVNFDSRKTVFFPITEIYWLRKLITHLKGYYYKNSYHIASINQPKNKK